MPEQTAGPNPNDSFAEAFGEPVTSVLDVQTWHEGADLATLYDALRQAVAASVEQERRVRAPIRQLLFSRIGNSTDRFAPPCAGVYQLTAEDVQETHRCLLFNGATECCDGTVAAHDSLLLSVVQIGIALVAYQGSQGTWVQRLYRRDLHTHHPDPVAEAMELLERRAQRPTDDSDEPRDELSSLVRRTLMEYAERALLVDRSQAPWRMGHGNPVPSNMLLLTGGGARELLNAGLDVLRRLIQQHRRFVYVASSPADRLLLTIGDALHPLEFAIVETLSAQFAKLRLIESRRAGEERKDVVQFMEEIGPEVVTGVYRAAPQAPARVFYAHRDHAYEAAAIAIADSVLQPYRGFPMLIDLADTLCGNTFDAASFAGSLQNAYAAAGEPYRYLGERETRA
ncbi:MAG TPA: hypothetical protein VFB21_16140 [Chthonomonadaceae bacterium]|nr:hypothetical protein [Chthonomonadaceae bacterium]